VGCLALPLHTKRNCDLRILFSFWNFGVGDPLYCEFMLAALAKNRETENQRIHSLVDSCDKISAFISERIKNTSNKTAHFVNIFTVEWQV
jgi:hypothetical protein